MNGVKNDSGVFRKLVCFTALRRPGLQIQLQHLHGAIYVLPHPNPHPTPQVGWMSWLGWTSENLLPWMNIVLSSPICLATSWAPCTNRLPGAHSWVTQIPMFFLSQLCSRSWATTAENWAMTATSQGTTDEGLPHLCGGEWGGDIEFNLFTLLIKTPEVCAIYHSKRAIH